MAVGVATGIQDTESGTAAEHVIDMAPDIAMLDPDTSQFITILQRLPSTVATQVKVNWLEDQLFPNRSTFSATANSATTTLAVATGEGAYFRAGDIVYSEASALKYLVSSVSGDNLTAAVIGATSAATAQTGTGLLIVGNASRQFADTGTIKATIRATNFNYTQIFRMPWGFSGTEVEVELYGADDPERETAKKTIEHKRQLELALWLGVRSFSAASGASGGSSLGTMGGVREFLTTNVTAAFGTVSLTGIDQKVEAIYQHGSMNKVAFVAPLVARALSNAFANNWVMARPDDNVYGAKVNAFINGSYGARLPLIVKRDWGALGGLLGGAMFVLDLDLLKRRPMRNRDTRVLPNRQLPGQDGVVFDILTEQSFQLAQESAHGLIYGITG